jgi:tRNA(Ile)-lysidine synthase
LCFQRNEIEKYLEEKQQTYCIDKTNLTDDYTRNKIRNHILPYAEENIVKGCVGHIYNTASLLKEQEDYLEEETLRNLRKVASMDLANGSYKINRAGFLNLHIFMRKRVLYKILESLAGSKKDITAKHVEGVLDLFEKEGMKYICLPYNLQAKSVYDCVLLEKVAAKSVPDVGESILEEAKGFTFRIFSDKMPDTVPEKQYTKWFDCDKIEGTLKVRTWQEGDFLTVQNGQHKKSLQRYFIDEKIPQDKRKEMLLLADGSHILWVIGKRISDYYKITKDTKNIIEIHYNGGNENGKTSY